MADDQLSAEINLDVKGFNLGVAGVLRSTETIESAFEKLSKQMDQGLERALAQVGKKLDSSLGQNLDEASKRLKNLGDAFDSGRLEDAASKTGAALRSVLEPATLFQAELSRVNTIAKLNETQLSFLGDSLSGLSAKLGVGVGPTETLAGAYEILSARQESAAGTTAILSTALVAAGASGAPTATSVDVLTSLLNSYSLAATDATRVSDVLFKTADLGKTTFEQLAPTIGNVAPLASESGVALEELGGAIAILTKAGIKTPTAVESIRAVIAALAAPTEDAKKAAAGFGIELNSTFLKSRGLAGALQEVATKTAGNSSALRKILGDISAFNAALKLTAGGGREFAAAIEANFNAAGASANAFAQRAKTLEAAQERLKAAGERLAVSIGEQVVPALTSVTNTGAKVVDTINEWTPEYIKFGGAGLGAVVSGAFAAAAALTGLVLAGNLVVGTLGPILGVVKNFVALRVASVALTAAMGGPGLAAIGATTAALLGIAAPIGIAAGSLIAYTIATKENTAAQEELLAIEERRAKAVRDGKDVIGKTAAQLRAEGKTAKDLYEIIGGLQDQAEAARREGNTGLVEVLNKRIADLQKVKAELAANPPAPAKTTEQVEQDHAATKKARDERIADEIQSIELSRKGDADKLKRFQDLLKFERLEGDERRRVEREIAQLEGKLLDDKKKKQKAAADEAFDQELQNVQHSKQGIDAQITALEALAQKYESNGDRRRKIEDQIAALQAKRAKEETDRIQAIADAEAKAADIRKQTSEGRTVDLEKQQERGLDVADQIAEERRQQGKEEIAALQKKLEEQLSKPENKSADVQVKLKNNTQAEIDNVNAATERDVQGILEKGAQDRAARAQQSFESEKSVQDKRIDVLTALGEKGVDVQSRLEAAVQDRLATEEASIRAAANAELAATSNVNRAKEIELRTTLEIQEARERAIQQLETQNQKLLEQKKLTTGEKGPIKGGSGFSFTLGGISSDINDRSAFESSGSGDFAARQAATAAQDRRRRLRARTGAASPAEMLATLPATGRRDPTPFMPKPTQGVLGRFGDFGDLEARRPDLAAAVKTGTPRKPSLTPSTAKAGTVPGAADPAIRAQRQDVNVKFGEAVVTVKYDGPKEQKVRLAPTTDGRTTPEAKVARRMSGKHGNGVRT